MGNLLPCSLLVLHIQKNLCAGYYPINSTSGSTFDARINWDMNKPPSSNVTSLLNLESSHILIGYLCLPRLNLGQNFGFLSLTLNNLNLTNTEPAAVTPRLVTGIRKPWPNSRYRNKLPVEKMVIDVNLAISSALLLVEKAKGPRVLKERD